MEDSNINIDRRIVEFLTKDIDGKEMDVLNNWKNEDIHNYKEFNAYKSVWDKCENLSLFNQINAEKDWNCVLQKINNKKANNTSKRTVIPLSIRKIAAIFIPILFIVTSGILYWNVPELGRLSSIETNTQLKEVILPDGSHITINKNSKIVYANNLAKATQRKIKLTGEAYFRVEHNKTPFIVNAGEVTVKVLGTEFNVEEQKSGVSVSVISGNVDVEAFNSKVNLTKGERAVIKNGNLVEEKAETINDIYWCAKQLKFKQANLADICKELQKSFPEIKVVKFNTKDLKTKVTTTFKNQSLKEIIEELEIHFDKKIIFEGSTLTVSD